VISGFIIGSILSVALYRYLPPPCASDTPTFVGLPILNPPFYPHDHCALRLRDHDQRKGSEEI
jgi:hypothetical protein